MSAVNTDTHLLYIIHCLFSNFIYIEMIQKNESDVLIKSKKTYFR